MFLDINFKSVTHLDFFTYCIISEKNTKYRILMEPYGTYIGITNSTLILDTKRNRLVKIN